MSGHNSAWFNLLAAPLRRHQWNKGYRGAVATDSLSAEELREYLNARLVSVVRGAARYIPFYRERFRQAGVDVERFSGIDDMAKLPTISKADIVSHGQEMLRGKRPSFLSYTLTTGGSTGTIATIKGIRGFGNIETGCIYALWKRAGVTPSDRIVRLRGTMLNEGRDLYKYDTQSNRLFISTFHLREDTAPEIVRLIDDFKPEWLHVYPSAAYLFASMLRQTGRKLSCRIKGILCSSENLFPWQQQLFREVFDCRVYTHYGHGELALLGGWCEKAETFHFLPNYGYLELLDEKGQPVTEPGVTGEMTGTGFLNPYMPMIRYRTADYGAWDVPGVCPACGRAHQRLQRIEGRIQEYLILADGTRFPATNINAMHGTFFSHIYRFQFVQDKPGEATLLFVPVGKLDEKRLAEIREAFSGLVAMGLKLDFRQVDTIPLTLRGKQRIVTTSVQAKEFRP
jgi:phenylacetate-CoA ligase